MTTPTKEQILFNLATAHEYLSEVPENKLDLKWFCALSSKCGTLMCAAGWLTEAPQFKDKMGLIDVGYGGQRFALVPPGVTAIPKNERGGYDFSWLDPIFGPDAFDVLFSERCDGKFDAQHPMAEAIEDFDETCLSIDGSVMRFRPSSSSCPNPAAASFIASMVALSLPSSSSVRA